VSLTAVTERVHSDGAIPPGRKSFLLMWVPREKALVHHLGAEPIETAKRWSPALGDGGCRFIEDILELAAIG